MPMVLGLYIGLALNSSLRRKVFDRVRSGSMLIHPPRSSLSVRVQDYHGKLFRWLQLTGHKPAALFAGSEPADAAADRRRDDVKDAHSRQDRAAVQGYDVVPCSPLTATDSLKPTARRHVFSACMMYIVERENSKTGGTRTQAKRAQSNSQAKRPNPVKSQSQSRPRTGSHSVDPSQSQTN